MEKFKEQEKKLRNDFEEAHFRCVSEKEMFGQVSFFAHGKRCEALGKFTQFNKDKKILLSNLLNALKWKSKDDFHILRTKIILSNRNRNRDLVEEDKHRVIINPQVRERDNQLCCFCRRDVQEVCREIGGGNTIHHIIPERYGGEHTEKNLITICGNCHNLLEKYLNVIEKQAIKATLDYIQIEIQSQLGVKNG